MMRTQMVSMKSSVKTQSTNQPNDERNRKIKKKKKNVIDDDNIVKTAVINNDANNKNVKKSSKIHEQIIHSKNVQMNQTRTQVANKNKSKNKNKNNWNNRNAADDEEVDASTASTTTTTLPPPPIKFERSNSFVLNRKLSNIYNALSNSVESLKNDSTNVIIGDADGQNDPQNGKKPIKKPTFKFMRSISLAAITLRKDYYYRSSMRKSKLEQLSEEDSYAHNSNQSSIKQNEYDSKKCDSEMCIEKLSSASVDSLCSRTSEKSTFSLMSSLKRTFSLKPNRRKTSNPKWSASLLNLQQIDNMISYEDLSFIDYDKFNTYEQSLMRHLSQQDVQLSEHSNSCSANINNGIICRHYKCSKNSNKTASGSITNLNEQKSNSNNNHINVKHFIQFPDVEMRLKENVSVTRCQRGHSVAIHQCFNPCVYDNHISIHAKINAINKFKRWSNPCDYLCVEGVHRPSSYASVDKIQQNHINEHCNDVNNEPIHFVDEPILDAAKRYKSLDNVLIDQPQIHDGQTVSEMSKLLLLTD